MTRFYFINITNKIVAIIITYCYILLLHRSNACSTQDNKNDCYAIEKIYNATIGLPWKIDNNNISICQLSGIACNNKNNRIVRLDLHNLMLRGSIPDEIGYLSELKELYLNANELSGTIPYSIGTLTQLTDLNLEMNLFEGPLIPSISNLTNLQFDKRFI